MAVPHYSLNDAIREADSVYNEDHMTGPGWESVEQNNEGVNYLFSKFFCTTADKTEVFVTKCSVTARSDPNSLFNTYWNGQDKWDFATIAKLEILENKGQGAQIVYQQHKVLSAASNKKDVVAERSFVQQGNNFKCYAVSVEHPSRPDKFQQHSRAFILFHSCYITETSPGVCDITFVWCWDFNGWIHQKFVDAEKVKVAQRITRLVKNTPKAALVPNNGPATRAGAGPSTASSSYAEYNQAVRQASAPVEEPVVATNTRPTNQPFHPQPVSEAAPATGGSFCSSCGVRSTGGKFCAGCGSKLQ